MFFNVNLFSKSNHALSSVSLTNESMLCKHNETELFAWPIFSNNQSTKFGATT